VSKGIDAMIETVCGLKKKSVFDTEQIKLDNSCVSLSEVLIYTDFYCKYLCTLGNACFKCLLR